MTEVESRRTIDSSQSVVGTPRIRTTLRRGLFWGIAVVIIGVIVIVTLAVTGNSQSTARLSGTNTHPAGARAVLQVLREDGVTVTTPRSLSEALRDATALPADTTVVLYDQNSLLTASKLDKLRRNVANLVLIEPTFRILTELAPDVANAGSVASTATSDCDLAPVQRAGSVTGLSKGYRITSSAAGTGCLGHSGVYSLVRVPSQGGSRSGTVTVLGSSTLMSNASVANAGNAALALGLLGQNTNLVWYLPSISDVTVAVDNVIPNPPWVGLLVTLATLVLLAAAFWRARRFGPVVVERLPVVVRSNETVEGRARLYQKASSRAHALDALRIGTLSRLAALSGLPKRASLDDVIGAVSDSTGRPLPELRALLVDALPATDGAMVRLSDDLLVLERDVATATRPA
jgi:hypothetical protein